jgi:hypothetical protein
MRLLGLVVATPVVALLLCSVPLAEEVRLGRAIPFGILDRVKQIQYGKSSGSCFVVDLDDRQYIITARHVVRDIGPNARVRLHNRSGWEEISVNPILAKDASIDIAALAPSRLIAPRMEVRFSGASMMLGQDVYFLGFPFGLGSRMKADNPITIPFVKKGIISAIDKRIMYIDGHNNPGFSGGPVIFANHSENDVLTIGAVISAYRSQPSRVLELEEISPHTAEDPEHKGPRFVLENTGIVVAHLAGAIEEAIRANPIGPKLPAK